MIKSLIPPEGPPRTLALAQLICRTGDGAYYISAAMFFTRVVGLSPAKMGLGLTIAWSVALILSVPLGHLADRRGPRGTAVILVVGAGLAVASYLVISSFEFFVVGACVYAVAQRGAGAAQQALLAELAPEGRVTEVRAFVQCSCNAGLALGAGFGGLALLDDRPQAYYAVFAFNASALFAASLVLSRLPAVRPTPQGEGADKSVFKDWPYIAISALNALLLLHIPLFDIALPLWISRHTAAPVWLLSAMFMLNTMMVVFFQVRVARQVTCLKSASRSVFQGSVLLAAACVVFAFTGTSDSAWEAGGLLLVAVAVQTVGEMMQTAGTWELSFGLAPKGKHGQYQAFFGNGTTVALMIGPLALTGLVIYWGTPGWILLGAIFVAAAAGMKPAVRWCARARDTGPNRPTRAEPTTCE